MKQHTVSVVDSGRSPLSVIVLLAWPIFLEQVLVALVQSIDTAMVGSLGAAATASVSISQNPINLINSVILALGVGFTTMIARAVGAGQLDYARTLIRQAILVVIRLGGILLRILALIQVPQVLAMIWSGALKGAGDTRSPFLITLVSMWGVRILGSFVLVHFFGRDLPWVCAIACVDNVVRCGLFWRQMRRSPWVLSRRQLAEAGADA